MNTTKLKSFAPKVRVQLMEAVSRKLDAVLMGKTADLLSAEAQVASLRRQAEADRAGLVERVAYTWFNRLAALRFLDARGWHPFHFRVLTPASAEESQPELLKEMRRGALPEELRDGVELSKLNDLLDGRLAPSVPGTDPQGEVYRHLILAVCHYYHQIMPFLFEAIDDETELLLPDDLLTATSVAQGFRDHITDTDCEAVEVLGWLYQFYISEKKDTVMARKKAVPTADIPAVTQLFTPHWIVRYLVENSLGRLWMRSHPESKLWEKMAYYVPEAGGVSGQGSVGSGQVGGVSGQGSVGSGQVGGVSGQGSVGSGQVGGVSGQGAEDSDQSKQYVNQNTGVAENGAKLQGFDRVAKGDGPGGGNLSTEQNFSQGGTLCTDESASKGGGVGSLKYCRRPGEKEHGGISQFSLDSTGISGGGGNANSACDSTKLPDQYGCPDGVGSPHRDQQNADLSPGQIKQNLTSTVHSPLTTGHLNISSPQEIRLLDPACGSGHMLTYAFDLLVAMYTEAGYPPSEIPGLILKHNLYGAEICPRAGALAAFALTMKAREVDRRFFQRIERKGVEPGDQIRVLKPVPLPEESVENLLNVVLRRSTARMSRENADPDRSPLWAQYRKEYRKKYKQDPNPALFERLRKALQDVQEEPAPQDRTPPRGKGKRKAKLLDAFEDAEALKAWVLDEIRPELLRVRQRLDELAHWDLYGALIRPDEELVQLLEQRLQQLDPDDTVGRAERIPLERILDQLQFLAPQYHVVVANPPYMGSGAMPNDLKDWAQQEFPDSKADLFAMFMERNRDLARPSGMFAMITMQSWMFLSSYESLREKLLQTCTLSSMAHLGPRGFDSIGGEVVSTTAFVFINKFLPDYQGAFFRLIEGQSEAEKEAMYLAALPKN